MAEKIKVELTRDDLVVYDHHNQRITAVGKNVVKTPFYARLIAEGALRIVRDELPKDGE